MLGLVGFAGSEDFRHATSAGRELAEVHQLAKKLIESTVIPRKSPPHLLGTARRGGLCAGAGDPRWRLGEQVLQVLQFHRREGRGSPQ